MKGEGEGEKGGGDWAVILLFFFFCVPFFFFFLAVESRIDYGWTLLWLT